jgi:hypothetical protein
MTPCRLFQDFLKEHLAQADVCNSVFPAYQIYVTVFLPLLDPVPSKEMGLSALGAAVRQGARQHLQHRLRVQLQDSQYICSRGLQYIARVARYITGASQGTAGGHNFSQGVTMRFHTVGNLKVPTGSQELAEGHEVCSPGDHHLYLRVTQRKLGQPGVAGGRKREREGLHNTVQGQKVRLVKKVEPGTQGTAG